MLSQGHKSKRGLTEWFYASGTSVTSWGSYSQDVGPDYSHLKAFPDWKICFHTPNNYWQKASVPHISFSMKAASSKISASPRGMIRKRERGEAGGD